MNFIEILLMISIALFVYFFIQVKNELRIRGHDVAYFYGWGSDFYKFKCLVENESSKELKTRYMLILYGLYGSVALLVLVAVIGVLVK